MRGNFSGHPHGDARCAVQEHKGQPGWQQFGFFKLSIVVGVEVDRIPVNFTEQELGNGGEAAFGIPHSCGPVAIPGAKIALPIDQWVAQ